MLEAFLHSHGEAGTDEAGRGCLAGPVTAAAVILPKGFELPGLRDSKQLSKDRRDELRLFIEAHCSSWSVAHVNPQTIDKINILKASILAMHKALDKLNLEPKRILVDGNRFIPYKAITHHCIVKGDDRFLSIAAASVLAKTHRDEYMEAIHAEFPMYNWKQNKGYPTAEHREALKDYGPCEYHRRSFQLLPSQLELPF